MVGYMLICTKNEKASHSIRLEQRNIPSCLPPIYHLRHGKEYSETPCERVKYYLWIVKKF